MQVEKYRARDIDGENGVYVQTGSNTFCLDGIVEEPNGKRVLRSFEVEGAATKQDAMNMVDYIYCGYCTVLRLTVEQKGGNYETISH